MGLAFSPIKCAFTGARLIVDRPVSSAALMFGGAVTVAVYCGVMSIAAESVLREASETSLTALLGANPATIGVATLISVLLWLFFQTAIYRAMLGGEDPEAARSSLLQDALNVVLAAGLGLAMFAAPTALLAGGGLAWSVETKLPQLPKWGAVLGALIGAVLALRFSLAGAASVARGRVAFFASWGLTNGAFWVVVLTHALTLAWVGALAYGLIWAARRLALFDVALWGDVFGGDRAALLAAPAQAGLAVGVCFTAGLLALFLTASSACAYRALSRLS